MTPEQRYDAVAHSHMTEHGWRMPDCPGCRLLAHIDTLTAAHKRDHDLAAVSADYELGWNAARDTLTAAVEDLRAAVELADTRTDAHTENPDGTVSEYVLSATDWNRVVAIARGSKSDAAERAIAPFREHR